MGNTHAADTYRRNAILTASPEKLVKLLYEGAIRNMERTRLALSDPRQRQSAEAGECLGKAMGIVSELRTSLDFEKGGQIARDLDRLYDFVLDQLSQANLKREPKHVEHGLSTLRTLKEGWDAVLPS